MKKSLLLLTIFLFLCLDSLGLNSPYDDSNVFERPCIEEFGIDIKGYEKLAKHPSNFTNNCHTNDYITVSEWFFDERKYKGSYNPGGAPAPYRFYFLRDESGNRSTHHGSFLLKDGTELKGVYYEYYGGWSKGKIDGGGILVFPNGSHYVGYFKNGKFNGPGYFTTDWSKFDEEEPFLYDQYDRLTNQGQYSKKSENSKESTIEKELFGSNAWEPICDYSVDSAKWDNCIGKKYLFKSNVLENINEKIDERRAEYFDNVKACKSGKGRIMPDLSHLPSRMESPKCLIEVDMVTSGGVLGHYKGRFKYNVPSGMFKSIMVSKKSETNSKDKKYIICWDGNLNKYGFLEGENKCALQSELFREAIVGYFENGKPIGIFNTYNPDSSKKPMQERQPSYIGEYDLDFNRSLGTSYKQDGQVEYKGEWGFGNKPNGFGEFFYDDGLKYKGEFKNGLKHGKGTLTDVNGKATSGRYEDGKKVGRHVEFNY
jgi:hypothetical protein